MENREIEITTISTRNLFEIFFEGEYYYVEIYKYKHTGYESRIITDKEDRIIDINTLTLFLQEKIKSL